MIPMQKLNKRVFFLIVSLFFLSPLHGQMVKGYFPYYRSVAQANAVAYNELTDVIYAFASIDANGNLAIMTPTTFDAVKLQCASKGVRLWVAIGGWGLSGNFSGVAADATRRNNLANACLNLCTTHNLAGIDIDWEFPAAGDKLNYTAMLKAIKEKIGPTYKLSAALGGESFTYGCVNKGHAVGVEAAAFTYLDYFNIMSYDAPGCFPNHTSLDFMQRSMEGWNALGCPYEKMIPGIAFYGRPDPDNHLWSTVADNTHFNDADGIVNGFGYDTKPTIEAKVNYAMCTMKTPGMMIWEISQDAPSSSSYDLLPVIKAAVNNCAVTCPFSKPNLGADVSLCGVSSVTLNSGIATNSPNRKFTWKRNGVDVVTNSTTATTLTNVNTAGTYKVVITEGTCTEEDEIVVSATLPTPSLGADKTICSPAFYNLSPSNLSSFPAGTSWQWFYGGTLVSGETTSSLTNVRKAGTYRLTSSISGCAATSDEIILSSNLPTPVDGCSGNTGPVSLSIANPGLGAGPYTWYATPSSTTVLHTGTSYSPSVATTTTFYVQDGALGASGSVGKPDNSGGWNGADYTQKIIFNVLQALTINSVVVYPSAAQNVTIRILGSDGSTVVAQKTFIGVGPGAQTLALNFNIPVGNGYFMDAVGTTGSLSYGGAFAYPSSIAGIISLTGQSPAWTAGDRYNYIFNWNVFSGSSCGRLPVIAKVGDCSTLPVTLSAFNLVKHTNKVELKWTTTSEQNNERFEIQRSANGEFYEVIGHVAGAGNSGQVINYSFVDHAPYSSTNYYRIVQFNFDGENSSSEIKSIDMGNVYQLTIAPNPFTDNIEIMLSDSHSKCLVKITDVSGKIILDREEEINDGKLKVGEGFLPGIYFVQIILNDEVFQTKIIKH